MKLHARLIAALLLGGCPLLDAATFVAPREGPLPFRRDQLPLDVDTMSGISRDLGLLANAAAPETAVEHRNAARMLALSLALDPGNTRSKTLLSNFVSGSHRPEDDAGKADRIREEIGKYVAWLETEEAGSHGKALALCLTDILAEDSEKGAWEEWIPPVSAYETGKVAEVPDAPTGDPAKTPAASPGIVALATAEMFAPLWTQGGTTARPTYSLVPGMLRMDAEKSSERGAPFSLIIVGSRESPELAATVDSVIRALGTKYTPLPSEIVVKISGEALEPSILTKKPQPVSAAIAILADAAISGKAPEAVIMGEISPTGAFKTPAGFWDQLQTLGPGKGERLVLPADSMDYLMSILALETPGFFMEREVLLAADFRQATELASQAPPEAVAAAMAKFKEIREKAPAQGLGSYLTNSFIRRRLAEIELQSPWHASARLLGLQAAGNRPIVISRPVLVSEIRKAVEPVAELLKSGPYSYEPNDFKRLEPVYDQTRAAVDRMGRYAAKEDRAVLTMAQEMVTNVRTVERASRSRGSLYESTTSFATAYSVMTKSYAALLEYLAREAGEPVK